MHRLFRAETRPNEREIETCTIDLDGGDVVFGASAAVLRELGS